MSSENPGNPVKSRRKSMIKVLSAGETFGKHLTKPYKSRVLRR